ncbi:3-hydroxyacyl-CoA dehydrogenase NAD-binding domain-containing protein [Thalassospira sp. TSL5-1]|uniref:3-hydroxyacyl-CoA dehydrogenase NAD-binding domain-containing protein n=1 Tax=Thalassospira sp. TSL5-1 TaxID=1544451 RepID=UPI00093FEEC4|nr:3-hydroxyacyl-CoA dehydrogenase NAD-binding domain-containing protein [Thalassospira sp. TSL5-1]OKH86400.1 3-hydroxyacyl-CoA dehydrogenase [Thalassospira sp. TSL5-1]
MTTVTLEFADNLAIIDINNPPINATSHAVRSGVMDALASIRQNPAVTAIILCCTGTTFIAGADISEFNQPARAPLLPDVIIALEDMPVPVIAALHGTVLGGGLEVALGCHYRIAHPATRLGFPEVNLGLIPGAGGTVRTPRLIGVENAISLISNGKPITASIALDWGLIDHITKSDTNLQQAAIEYARKVATQPCPTPLAKRNIPDTKQPDWDSLIAKTAQKARGATAPIIAVETIRDQFALSADQALANERQQFVTLREGEQSQALRHIFMAERNVAKLPTTQGVTPTPIKTIGIVGGGLMGAGIATACLLAGYQTIMIERDEAALAKGRENVASHLQGSLKRGIISQERNDQLLSQLHGNTDYAALAPAELVIEAVFEDLEVKKSVFDAVARVVDSTAIIASNTSYLDINALAHSISNPERVIGLHFFSPAHIMKLLEVVCTDGANPQTLATALAFARKLGKIAVPTGVCDGFIGNRIMSAYRKQCEYMIEDGAYPEQIDAAMTDFGFPMGLFAMQDMAGLEISWKTRQRQAATRDPNERYVALGDYLCEQGRFGRKTGLGWFRYDTAKSAPQPDPDVKRLIEQESARKGIKRRDFSPSEIIQTILATMQQEGDKILNEGVAHTADAIDVVMINGYGFPRWRGGPMFMKTKSPVSS